MGVHQIYVLCVWLHLAAMATWLGGMVFLAVVVLPVLRQGPPEHLGRFMARATTRLRTVGWTCLAILGLTGWAQLHFRGLDWNTNTAITMKVFIYLIVVALSLVHDFWLGPAAGRALREAPAAPATLRLRSVARRMGQVTALLALTAVFLGVVLVRGTPW